MRRTGAGLAGLVVLVAALLTACGSTASSVRQAASSIAASHSGSVTQSAGTPSASAAAPSTAASQPAPTKSAVTVAPSAPPTHSAAASAAPAATATATGSGSGLGWAWLWVILAVAVLAGLSIWAIAARHRRRANAANSWRTRVIDAYAKGAALHDAMAAAQTPAALAAPDAGLRWSDIQRRADDYGQLLYGMQQAAPGDQERILVSDVIASLQAVRSAIDAERSAATSDDMLSGIVRDRIAFFASSLRALREPDVHPV